ncbi:ClbS/DfsB family four-helix bundle protein [Agromyces sp. CFH 90414]|uniref:ClbS/DfsB family four-helix bundle protein n=1 Tax=Agromyces agglutinans TaxID=2662258 RepID=A0A6I2F8S2_9MICO|nr:ClbS/DfsB family four-helix bundle protein [Agromyces agglutinans]MRG60644.1 ClbS/DfsB family four-helix bundle protein [Agromyces agglutinans]
MPAPTTRTALEAAAFRGFRDLDDVIEAMPAAEAAALFPAARTPAAAPQAGEAAPGADAARDRDVQDVLNHLHAWHLLLLGWLDADAAGKPVEFPAPGHTWDSLAELNVELRDRYRVPGPADAGLATARGRLRASHIDVLTRIESMPDDDLLEPGRRPWLRGPLAEPVHECLGGHYEWAIATIPASRSPRP